MTNTLRHYDPPKMKDEGDILLTLDEVAEMLDISKWTLGRICRENGVERTKIGGRSFIPMKEIERLAWSH